MLCPYGLFGYLQGSSVIIDFLEGPETVFPAVLDLCSRNADVGEALFYFGADGNTWANLYKICEIIKDYCGGNKELLDRGWCSRSNLERFDRTANHQEAIGLFSRHARARAVPPPDPMTMKEAQNFALELLNRWIDELLSGEPGRGLRRAAAPRRPTGCGTGSARRPGKQAAETAARTVRGSAASPRRKPPGAQR